MLVAGTPLPEVSHVLGHSSIRITDEVHANLGHEALWDAVVIGWLECWTRVCTQTCSGDMKVIGLHGAHLGISLLIGGL